MRLSFPNPLPTRRQLSPPSGLSHAPLPTVPTQIVNPCRAFTLQVVERLLSSLPHVLCVELVKVSGAAALRANPPHPILARDQIRSRSQRASGVRMDARNAGR